MDKINGARIPSIEHIRQSVADIIMTAIGERCMLRSYGCMLRRRVDAPLNAHTLALLRADIAIALARWEPRIELFRIQFSGTTVATLAVAVWGRVLSQTGATMLEIEVRNA